MLASVHAGLVGYMGADWAYFPGSGALHVNPSPGGRPRVRVAYDEGEADIYTASTELALVPTPRVRPKFCIGGDKDGEICEPHCEPDSTCGCSGGGACVDDPAMSCYEHDFGIKCYELGII